MGELVVDVIALPQRHFIIVSVVISLLRGASQGLVQCALTLCWQSRVWASTHGAHRELGCGHCKMLRQQVILVYNTTLSAAFGMVWSRLIKGVDISA